MIVDALKVRVQHPKQILNLEEQPLSAEPMSIIENAFKRIDAFGLRVELLEMDQEIQLVYTATLSAFRFKVQQADSSNACHDKKTVMTKEQEFSNTTPHYMRNTLLNEMKSKLKCNQQICSGWFSVLLTKQRSITANGS